MARTRKPSPKWEPSPKCHSVLSCVGLDWTQDPEEWKWKYGYQRAPLLHQSDQSPDGLYYMTSTRMVDHVGLLEDVYNDPLAKDFYDTHPNEWTLRQRMAIIEFDHKVLVPIRRQLEQRYESTFYRLPALEYKIHPKTGLVVFMAKSESTLKLLPLSKDAAMLHGMKMGNIKLILPDVIYVILMKKRAYRTIKDASHLLYYLDGWMKLIRDGEMRNAIHRTFKEKSPNLMDNRVEQLMLNM